MRSMMEKMGFFSFVVTLVVWMLECVGASVDG